MLSLFDGTNGSVKGSKEEKKKKYVFFFFFLKKNRAKARTFTASMSMFFTNEPNANRFAARNRNQGSLDIFGTGASSSAAPATSRPSSRASAPHLSHTDHTSSSVPASSPARNQVEVAEK